MSVLCALCLGLCLSSGPFFVLFCRFPLEISVLLVLSRPSCFSGLWCAVRVMGVVNWGSWSSVLLQATLFQALLREVCVCLDWFFAVCLFVGSLSLRSLLVDFSLFPFLLSPHVGLRGVLSTWTLHYLSNLRSKLAFSMFRCLSTAHPTSPLGVSLFPLSPSYNGSCELCVFYVSPGRFLSFCCLLRVLFASVHCLELCSPALLCLFSGSRGSRVVACWSKCVRSGTSGL